MPFHPALVFNGNYYLFEGPNPKDTTSAFWDPSALLYTYILHLRTCLGDFPGGPVVRTLCFQCRGCGFDPRMGN